VVVASLDAAALNADGTSSVRVHPGTGLVVYPVPMADPKKIDPYLVSDEGVAHHMPDPETLSALKISSGSAVPMPKGLLALIPPGPLLSKNAIRLA
jgi:hypothetical protein